jgi:hypothetical protein
VWWEDNEYALPTRKLYLNVSGPAPDNEEEETGRRYEFRFLKQDEYEKEPTKWFRVGKIVDVAEAFPFNKMLNERGYQQSEFASEALSTLHSVIQIHKLINYYLIQKSDIDRYRPGA